jgi:hypothetical protein
VQFASAHLKKSRLLDVTVLGLHRDRTDEIAKKTKERTAAGSLPIQQCNTEYMYSEYELHQTGIPARFLQNPKTHISNNIGNIFKKNKVSSVLTRILKCTMAGGTKAHGKVPIGITRHLSLLTMICE